jgi:ATPase family AAA domain-containing protein 3A/B
MHPEGGLYFNVEPVNTTDSLNLLRVLPLRTFEFRHDTVRGRRQLGVIGQELMQIVPESVSLVDKQAFPSPIKGAPPIYVDNFLSVDKNVVLMHGLASAQELVLLYDTLEEIVNELSSVVAEHDALIGKLSEHLERDAVVDLIEKRRVAEANSEKLRLAIEEVRVKEDEARITLERQTELEEKRDDHRNDLEIERIQTQDRIQRERDLALVELQEKSSRRLEEQRRETEQILHEQTLAAEAEKAKEDREAELERLKQEIEGRIRQVCPLF